MARQGENLARQGEGQTLARCSPYHWMLTGRTPAGRILAGWTIGEQRPDLALTFCMVFPELAFRLFGNALKGGGP